MDIADYNRRAWDHLVEKGNQWTVPVTPEETRAARDGHWHIVLTPSRAVPRHWFPPLADARTLCLAGAGGQQGPILAAAGARVTVFDNSPRQLSQDRFVASRDGLDLATVQGDMRDLGVFADAAFDLVVHPCSNCFVPDVRRVWREAHRVLRRGGALLAGFCDPIIFTLDPDLEKQGVAQLRYTIPYSDLTSLTDEERRRYTDAGEPLSFGHTLEDQIGGQCDAGLVLTGMYSDRHVGDDLVSKYMPCFHATRSITG
jgi:SAM-dependent methyltransferase